MTIRISNGGLLSTFQDKGRFGYSNMGIPCGGAMDIESLYIANALVSRPLTSPVLEMTGYGVSFEAGEDMVISLTGARVQAYKNDLLIPSYESIPLRQGDKVRIQAIEEGLRAYVGFSCPLKLDQAFDSQSTYKLSGFGGYKGRPLKAGDLITSDPADLPALYKYPTPKSGGPIRLILSYEHQDFDLGDFFESTYRVSQDISRMGMKLQGPPLQAQGGHGIISSPVCQGTIQVPGSGQPIILLKDGQTTGGYKRLGCVIYEDLQRLGAYKPGDPIRFSPVTLSQAKALKLAYLERLASIKDSCVPIRAYEVKVADQAYYVSVEIKE